MASAAFTIAYGKEAVASARLLRATFKAVHPDVPFFLLDGAFWPFLARQPRPATVGEIVSLRTLAGYFLAQQFERVVYFDADVLLLAPVPRLLEQRAGEAPVLLTRDKKGFDYSLPGHPLVNAGVLASSLPGFWLTWAMTVYGTATRLAGNFFDQFALRFLAHQQAFPHLLLPDEEDYHNIGYLDLADAPWRREGEEVFRGDRRVRVWHWAGYAKKPSTAQLPPPVREVALARLARAQQMGLPDYEAENRPLLDAVADPARTAPFHAFLEKEFREAFFQCLDGLSFPMPTPEGLFGCDAPAGWEALRAVPEGLHRRLLPNAPRYLYARSEERLWRDDVARYDQPFPSA